MKSAYIISLILYCFLPSLVLGNDLYSKMGVIEPQAAIEAPSFTLESVNGGKRSLHEFKGKVVLINFWATWCGPCREEIPALEKLEKKYRRGLP